MLGLDYSGGRPAGRAVATAGYGFVGRYLPNGLASGRVNLSAAEVSDMHGAGVAVVMVWETQANRASAGRAAGVADATMAAAQAKVVGQSDLPIYFAVDFDLPDYSPAATSPIAKLGPVGEYFAGVVSVLGLSRTGVYGGYWAVRRCLDAGLASWAWQTVAWSGGLIDPRIHLYQRAGYVTVDGVQCDINEARQANYGQGPASSPTLITTEDDSMGFWAILSQGGKEVGSGFFSEESDFLGQPVPASVRAAGAFSNLNDGVTDDEAMQRWQDLVTRYDRNIAKQAKALADALKADGIGVGGSDGIGGQATEYELTGTLTPKTS